VTPHFWLYVAAGVVFGVVVGGAAAVWSAGR